MKVVFKINLSAANLIKYNMCYYPGPPVKNKIHPFFISYLAHACHGAYISGLMTSM